MEALINTLKFKNGISILRKHQYEYTIFPKGVFDSKEDREFEGKLYNVPNNTDAYLKTLYGKNYMKPKKTNPLHLENVVFLKELKYKENKE